MKTLYLECNMGASGDMLLGALLELAGRDKLELLNSIGLEDIHFSAETAETCGIQGTHARVVLKGGIEEQSVDIPTGHHGHHHEESSHHHHEENHHHDHSHEGHTHSHTHDGHPHHHHGEGGHHHHEHAHDSHGHHHSGMCAITKIINGLAVSDEVKEHAAAVYRLIADAESHAHGRPVEQIHFHEVGTLDAVADIVGVCLLMEAIAPEEVIVSPIHVGSGQVRCAHGILPVPAPATAHILRGAPIYGGSIQGELCTPTGAALLRHFATRFDALPPMEVDAIGYGLGTKQFAAANCVRALLGHRSAEEGQVAELRCNLDDLPPEAIGYATRLLLAEGALDVFSTPVYMKKDRPGTLLTCLCNAPEAEKFASLLLLHTTTNGVRQTLCSRYTLRTSHHTVQTPYGAIRVKTAEGYGVQRQKPEYDDVAAAADKHGVPFTTVWNAAKEV